MEYTTVVNGVPELSLLRSDQIAQLTQNGLVYTNTHDAIPCVHLSGKKLDFLLSEISMSDPDKVYGLFYQGDKPVVGYISLQYLNDYHENRETLYNRLSFNAEYKLSTFKAVGDEVGKIIWDHRVFPEKFEKYSR